MKREFELTDDVQEALEEGDVIEKLNWRHGHRDVIVFKFDGAHWQATIAVHHEEGWQVGKTISAVQVQQVEKTVKVWEAVPDPAG